MRFLQTVREMVAADPAFQTDIIQACTSGMLDRYVQVNDQRVEAEVCLSQVVDFIPESKVKKHPSTFTRAKMVLAKSGMFNGTEYAKRLRSEIGAEHEPD